jgi:hypothetical protein
VAARLGALTVGTPGGQPGNRNATVHGLHSEAQVVPLARLHRRRVLRSFGVRARDLSPLGRAYVDQVVRLRAKIDLIDQHIERVGLIRDDGTPEPCLALYGTLENSLRLALARLETHLGARVVSPEQELHAYIAATYGDDDC